MSAILRMGLTVSLPFVSEPSVSQFHLRPSGIVTTQLERCVPSYRTAPPVTSPTTFAAFAVVILSYSSSTPKVISLSSASVIVIVFSFPFFVFAVGPSPRFF